jgi:hypothetical protein
MIKPIIWIVAFTVFAMFVISNAKAEPDNEFRLQANQDITYDYSAKRHSKRVRYAAADQQYSYQSEGGRPSGCPHAWCGCWLSMQLFGENRRELWRAFNWLKFPKTSPHVGAVAVMGRKGGGHVGLVTGFDDNDNPILKSGNSLGAVRTAPYPKGRIMAYVQP